MLSDKINMNKNNLEIASEKGSEHQINLNLPKHVFTTKNRQNRRNIKRFSMTRQNSIPSDELNTTHWNRYDTIKVFHDRRRTFDYKKSEKVSTNQSSQLESKSR